MPDDPVRNEVVRQFREDWCRMRLKSRRRFAVTFGVGIFGGVFASGYVLSQIYKGQFNFLIDAGFVIACAAAGYFVGLKAWDANEAQFLADDRPVNPPAPNPDATPDSD
jgi:hypothetical protein